jgi:hypothetical protein
MFCGWPFEVVLQLLYYFTALTGDAFGAAQYVTQMLCGY